MNGMTKRLKTAVVVRGHTQPLVDGTVTPRTFEFDFEDVPVIIKAFRRMVRHLEFDVCEMAMTTYLCARDHGKPFTALPIFPMRALHHGAIVYNTRAGVHTPKDLEGKKVGVNRGYTVTTGLWIRSILQHEHGVDLSKVTWVLSGDEHVAEYRPPANVVPIEKGKKMGDMLAAGELDAAIGADVDSPDVKPLIANAKETAFKALADSGHYPINHLMVVKEELLQAHPELGPDLFNAFTQAKRLYVEKLRAGAIEKPTAVDEMHKRVMGITGRDPLPYGIEPNRAMLEEVIGSALEQKIIMQPVTVEELFPRNTHSLVG